MPAIPSRDRTEMIDEIRRYAEERLTPEWQRLFQTFIGQYYRHVAREDLAARHVHDLYGAAMSHLTLALDRPPREPAVSVYSPDFEAHGFGSPHTVVDIVTDDMPFVVASVTTEVIRHGLGLHLTVRPVVSARRDTRRLVDILDRDDPASGADASPQTEPRKRSPDGWPRCRRSSPRWTSSTWPPRRVANRSRSPPSTSP